MRSSPRRPSAATVIATVALLVALGGTATAAMSGGNSTPGSAAPEANPAATFAPTQRGPRGPRGKRGPRGFRGLRGLAGPAGAAGAAGAAGSALAFAHVLSTGSLDATNSKAVTSTNLARAATGTYCFSGLNPAPRNAVASVGNTGAGSIIVVDLGQFGVCPAGTQVSVRTFSNTAATTLSDTEFMVQFN